jgi:hypothetical protein
MGCATTVPIGEQMQGVEKPAVYCREDLHFQISAAGPISG